MADSFILDGTPLDLAAEDALPIRYRERFGATPELTISRRGIHPPPEASDTWMGKTLEWSYDSGGGPVTYFSGTIRSRTLRRAEIGWVIDYQAHGRHELGNKFPVTDKTTGLDTSPFNCSIEDLANYSAARAGRTVGQILTDVLTSKTNAANLTAYGLGNLTLSSGVYSLPSATVTDLAALDTIPPKSVYVTGEQFFEAIDGLLQSCAPNHRMWVDPTGDLRFRDLRSPAVTNTVTQGDDPIEPVQIDRDVGACWQRLVIRGAPLAVMGVFKLSSATLAEDFGYGATSNAAAKTAWTPAKFKGTTGTLDKGTCTCPSTTTVTVTSADTALTWASNYWDQTSTGAKGTINLEWSSGSGITTFWTARIVANTSLSAAGTSTVTIDAPLPHTSFNKYTITGQVSGPAQVWRKYLVVDTTIWPLVVNQSTYPQPVVNAGGGATMTSTMMGLVFWPQSGSSPPYNCFPLPFVWDASTGHVYFQAPTYIVANNAAPADVWVYLPVNTGPNQVASPPDVSGSPVFAGDSNSIEGLTDTLVGTLAEWRDPGQVSQVQAYADDWIDAVKDGVRTGSVIYHGMYEDALTFGLALNVAGLQDDGSADTTGWEAAAIPVVEVEIEWPSISADDYVTTIGLSSAKAHGSAALFLRPEQRFTPIGLAEGSEPILLGASAKYEASQEYISARADQAAQPYEAAAGRVGGLADQARAGTLPQGGVTDLGAPQVGVGYGGAGELNVPGMGAANVSEAVGQTLGQLGADPTGGVQAGTLKDMAAAQGVPTVLSDVGVDPTGGGGQ